MTVSAISSSTATATTTSSSALELSSSDFLELMLEQLQNQNPLDPTDTSEYMNQMVSYASYDQLSEITSSLDQITSSLNAFMSTSSLSYISSTVEAEGDTSMLSDGSASWNYSLNRTAAATTITVSDTDGNTVWTGSGETSSGDHGFTWDGTDSNGDTVADGAYTISVAAVDAAGTKVSTSTSVVGKVTGIGTDDSGTTTLLMGDVEIAFDSVIKLSV
ncbi:MAG: flagellar biosynthesis protein FlgD [Hyphomicrobiales bacterium]|nr:MAG: flagellar biosynthesis protein FlgD [Hyphomicrobiales bacterium]